MAFVLDASIALAWAFVDERQISVMRTLARMSTEEAVVPSLWRFEVRNALLVNERRGRLAEADKTEFLQHLSRLRIVTDDAPDERVLLNLARRHRLSAYDAAYLELAQRAGIPLATLDKELAQAARAEKLVLV